MFSTISKRCAVTRIFLLQLGLMLMLVAMTYNPSLFVALVVGYFIGDYIFHYPAVHFGKSGLLGKRDGERTNDDL